MGGLQSFFYRFCATSLINSIIQHQQILDSIYHMVLELLKYHCFSEDVKVLSLLHNVKINVITSCYKMCKPLVVYHIYCMALYRSQR